jgi:hypothetical protein
MSMNCAIMQPTYLPWSGYFNLISESDIFVFLDDVQFNRRSWQSRNRILLNGKSFLLTIPTKKKGGDALINEIEVAHDVKWRNKHLITISRAYANLEYGKEVLDIVNLTLSKKLDKLLDYNIEIIQTLSNALGLSPEWKFSSEMNCNFQRSKKIEYITKQLGCDKYWSPLGSKQYLEEDKAFQSSEINLAFQLFTPREYPQNSAEFIASLSIIDVIAHLGIDGTKEYIKTEGVI